jgi:hypothetical protein
MPNRFAPRVLVIIGVGVVALLSGCKPIDGGAVNAYYGPTQTMGQVVRAVNENNTVVPTLWSDHTFRAWIHDDKKKEHYVDGDGVLLFRKVPGSNDELLLQGHAIIGKIFEIGSSSGSDAEYWVAVIPEVATEWWGRYKNLGKPCAQEIPIHPDLVTQVLGLSEFDTNLLEPPVPTMRFNNDRDVYMFTWNVPLPDRWAVQKEVWYDRKTLMPSAVLLFDENGRILLRAYLSGHQAIEGANGKKVATHYDLFFPDTKDRLIFNLKNPKLTNKGVPKPGTIRRRPIPDVREVQIDAGCP